MDSQPKLLELFDICLEDQGRILLASKIHYFGNGGGLRQFESVLDESMKWEYKTVKEIGTGLKREILELKRKNNK